MKNVVIGTLFVITVVVGYVAATSNIRNQTTNPELTEGMSVKINVVEHDQCEYVIIAIAGNNRIGMTHKGNCKNPIHKKWSD